MAVEGAALHTGPVFDRGELLRRLGGDPVFLKEILKLYLDDTPLQLERLRRAVAEGDAAEMRAAGHRLRGAAANLAGHRLQRAAEAMERSSASATAAERAALLRDIEAQFALLEQAMLEEWLA